MRVLLIDDTRDESSPEIKRRIDVIARNYWEGIRELEKNGPWDLLFLDHDLNSFDDRSNEYTGYHIACFLEENPMFRPKQIICVSSNPPGRARIEAIIKRFK